MIHSFSFGHDVVLLDRTIHRTIKIESHFIIMITPPVRTSESGHFILLDDDLD